MNYTASIFVKAGCDGCASVSIVTIEFGGMCKSDISQQACSIAVGYKPTTRAHGNGDLEIEISSSLMAWYYLSTLKCSFIWVPSLAMSGDKNLFISQLIFKAV